jgi:isopropylmalate/homocitrate/citramalate synthase
MPKVYIIDVTNRDGDQTARIVLSKLQKTVINWLLDEMGVFQSEIGFPLSHHERRYINANVELTTDCNSNGPLIKRLQLSGWLRALVGDVETALRQTNLQHFNLSISTSEQMLTWKFRGRFTRADIIKMAVDAIQAARGGGALTVGINAEDASRTDLDFLVEFAQASREAGADRFRYCDTLGHDDPQTIASRVRTIAREAAMPVELHCHNDLGLAVATSCAGAVAVCEEGYDAYINTTVNGIGERAGNADLVSCILALRYASRWGDLGLLDEHLDLSKAWRLANYVANAFGVPIPINQPGVGANAFAHESGIHADGALKDRHNYELYDYEVLGRGQPQEIPTGRVILTGVHGGLAGLQYVYSQMDLAFRDDEHAREILQLVQYANLANQAPLTQEELWLIYHYPEQVREILTAVP